MAGASLAARSLALAAGSLALAAGSLALAACSLALAACSLAADITPPPGAAEAVDGAPDAARSADGAVIYAEHCAACHGATGRGDGAKSAELLAQRSEPLPDFTAAGWAEAHTTSELFQIVTEGRLDRLMPPWRSKLSDDERRAVVGYLFTLAGAVNASAPMTTAAPASQAPEATSEPPGTAIAATNATGTVTGHVTNGTRGGALNGLEVVLHGYDDFSLAQTLTATVQADGSFAFTAVPTRLGRQYLATARHDGLTYSTDLFNFESQSLLAGLELVVYDTTQDASVLRVAQMHVTLDMAAGTGQLGVTELLLVSNNSDWTYVPASGAALSVPLPAGATGVTLPNRNEGLEYDPASGTVQLNAPIRPGANAAQATMSFRMPFDGRLDFEQTLAYPVEALSLLLPKTGLSVEAAWLRDQGLRSLSPPATGALQVFSAANLPANEALAFRVLGQASSGQGVAGMASAGLLIGLAAAGGVAVAAVLRARRRSLPAAAGDPYDALLQQVADLDDAFAAGELEPETYRAQRARMKRDLLQMSTRKISS
jgi:mono/diheme cytochrome c family protein